jgi:hypothetical protein
MTDKVGKWILNPIILSAIIAATIYYLYSKNYITKENYKDKLKISTQRYANIKSAVVVFVILIIVIYVIKSIKPAKVKKEAVFLTGNPDF